jgi:hypothetical protein
MYGPENDLRLLNAFDLEQLMQDPDDRANVLAWYYFSLKVLCPNVKPGWSFDGCSFSQRGTMVLLVVKATHEGTPYVAFTTERTTTGCVRSFCRRWIEDRVEWHPDKFR